MVARGQASGGSRSTERITNGGRISDRVWNMWIGNNETPSRKIGIMSCLNIVKTTVGHSVLQQRELVS